MTTDELKAELQRLDVEERAELALYLVDSLDSHVDPDADELWEAELFRRMEEIRLGKVQGTLAHQVMAELRVKYSHSVTHP